MRRQTALNFFFTLLIMLLAACTGGEQKPSPSRDGRYPVDPLFQEYYDKLGGVTVLGPAISPLFHYELKSYQYTSAVLLEYDSSTLEYRLASIGIEFGISENIDSIPIGPKKRVINGIPIYQPFIETFDRMGGLDAIGFPLSQVRFNGSMQRYEQYFERAGFFILEGDPASSVYLLSYGAWKCHLSCQYVTPPSARLDMPVQKAAPFVNFVQLYGINVTGLALSEPFLASDGNLEQVYENVILITNPEHGEQVRLRSLPELVGIPRSKPEKENPLPGFEFVATDGNLGYNIPAHYIEYLEKSGSHKLAGAPSSIGLVIDQTENVYCFEYLCLAEKIDAYGVTRVAPLALGYKYREEFSQEIFNPSSLINNGQVGMQIWESNPMISPDISQEIGVTVFVGNQPLLNISPDLFVTMPDGSVVTYHMPLTGMNGESRTIIEPVSAPNGTLIPYKVCVNTQDSNRLCIRESFLVWNPAELNRANVQYLPVIYKWIVDKLYQVYLPYVQSSK